MRSLSLEVSMPIKTVKIHPAIAIARIGNSPTDFFIGRKFPAITRCPPAATKMPPAG